MRVLAFRHIPFEGAGLIGPALEASGISLEYADLYQPGAGLPDTGRFDGLIFMGGPMSVNDRLPYLRWEMDAIVQSMERHQPVLGICLGSQLIAKAMGARVYPNRDKEIGWFDIHLTEAARRDPMFADLPKTSTVFHWHGETFDLPPGATLLASSERCRNQAFRVGYCTYGLQFHLEVTPDMIADWCMQDANAGDVKELDGPVDTNCNSKLLEQLAATVFGRWGDVHVRAHHTALAR
jgi:GMP synthase (glutamine-hydrolysing)